MTESMVVPQKSGTELLLCDPAIPFLGIYPKVWQPGNQTDICIPMFLAALFHNSLEMGATHVPINSGIYIQRTLISLKKIMKF